MNWIKANIFNQDPDSPINFHRTDILGFKGPFQALRDEVKHTRFNKAVLRLMTVTNYVVITALIDKKWMLKQEHWNKKHPYHYLMEIVVEKYTQFLHRSKDIGDIMPESREGKDHLLQHAFSEVRRLGTDFVKSTSICSAIRAESLKFRNKKDNVAGLQLCDLIAHPSHITVRQMMGHDVNLGTFAERISTLLKQEKYDRSPWSGKIVGYGVKHLPQ